MSSFTNVELNLLIFRYLQESGFVHSASNFGSEASVNNLSLDGNVVPPGALVSLVAKGLLYLEMEANLNNNDADVERFSFLQSLDLLTKDEYQLRTKSQEKAAEELAKEQEKQSGLAIERDKQSKGKEHEKDKERVMKEKLKEKQHYVLIEEDNPITRRKRKLQGPEPMDTPTYSTPACSSDVMILEGHTSEVGCCAWSPAGSLLASGSDDSTARIWTIAGRTHKSSLQKGSSDVLVLQHKGGKAVTTLAWNWEGTLLTTGSCDGLLRTWSTNGELRSTLNKHSGAIISIKWNKKGDYLLTGSDDKTAIIWDLKANECKQQFEFHSGPTLDVDWRNNRLFASSSADNMIYICKVGENEPIKTFAGHEGEVNCVKWDPTGSLLASCSDDTTVKVWNMKQDKHIHDLREHKKEVYTIRWSPTGPGTRYPNQQLFLASASFDSTVKLWDAEHGRLIRSLNGHRDSVYALAFSPNGKYLASGSLDKSVHVWSMADGKIVKTYSGDGSIFELCWNKEGDRIAACTNKNSVYVLDFEDVKSS